MVRQWQEMFYNKRYSMSTMDAQPDFVKLAEAYGHRGIRVENFAQLRPALEKALALKDETVFVDIIVDPTENVFPMIPAGGGQADMILAQRSSEDVPSSEGMVLVWVM